ncbi:MAG TPA: hypothetical protein VHH12_11645 [Mycobacterium sp.]|nr:hypothetical protein [Mycobacterium sp.]
MSFRVPMGLVATAAVTATLTAPLSGAQPGPAATDERGFVATDARCDGPAVAFGRTQYALVAICGQRGAYEYRGVRLDDDALLAIAAVESTDGVFTARNDDVTYTFSAKELAVTSGEKVLRADPMVIYVEPARN